MIVRRKLQGSLLHRGLDRRNDKLVRWLIANMTRLVVMTKLIKMLVIVARIQCCCTWRGARQAKCRSERLAALRSGH